MMKILFLVLAAAISVNGYDTYDNSFHYADKEIEVLQAHMDCYLDRGPCDEVSKSYLEYMQHAMETVCTDCSTENKYAARTLYLATLQYLPDDSTKLFQKLDPNNEHREEFLKAILSDK